MTVIAQKLHSSSHLGGKHKTGHFYPKVRIYPIYSEDDSVKPSAVIISFDFKKNKKKNVKKKCGHWITPQMGMPIKNNAFLMNKAARYVGPFNQS